MKLVVLTDSVFISVSLFLLSCFVFTGHMSTTKSQSAYFERSNINLYLRSGSLNLCYALTPVDTIFCVL